MEASLKDAEDPEVVDDKKPIEKKKKNKIAIGLLLLLVVVVVVVVVLTVTLTSKSTSDSNENSTREPSVPTPTQHPTASSPPSLIPTFVLPNWSQLGEDLLGQEENDEFATVALNADGSVLAVGSIGAYSNLGAVRLYKFTKTSLDNSTTSFASPWTQLGSDVIGPPFTPPLPAKFGGRLSLSKDGMVMAATAPFINAFQGAVYVYRYSLEDDDWMPYGNTSDGVVGVLSVPGSSVFGFSVSLSGDGMKLAVSDRTFAAVYGLTNGIWEKVGQDIGDSNVDSVDLSEDGRSLAVRLSLGRTVRVYFLHENDEEWVQVGNDILNKDSGSGFMDLSADAKTIAMSEIQSDEKAGYVIVLRFDTLTGNWTRLGPAVGSPELLKGTSALDEFGSCVSLSADGNRILVGSRGFNNNSGLVRLLDWTDEEWVSGSVDVLGNPDESLGFYCSLAGSRMALGSPSFDNQRGFVRTFELEE